MPKYDKDVAILINAKTGDMIWPESKVKDFRGDETVFMYISQLPGGASQGKIITQDDPDDRFGGREVYPSVIDAKIIVREDAGPRWVITEGGVPVGRTEQWSNPRNVVDVDNPKSVADYKYIAMSSKWSHTATQEIRETTPGIHEVWAVREPFKREQGYKHEDTGIRIIDSWLHGK